MTYYQNHSVTLYHDTCQHILPILADQNQKYHLVITDLPYHTTHNLWDSQIIPFDFIWSSLSKIIYPTTPVIFFGQGIFTASLIMSNPKSFKYTLVWKKGNRTSGFLNAKHQPLRNHEDIIVFYDKSPTYHPQFTIGTPAHSKGHISNRSQHTNHNYNSFNESPTIISNLKYPTSILDFDRPHPPIHPTQKPVELIEYLINTYSNPNDHILDFTAGSGTTAIAALNTNRKATLIEQDTSYCKITVDRINQTVNDIHSRLF